MPPGCPFNKTALETRAVLQSEGILALERGLEMDPTLAILCARRARSWLRDDMDRRGFNIPAELQASEDEVKCIKKVEENDRRRRQTQAQRIGDSEKQGGNNLDDGEVGGNNDDDFNMVELRIRAGDEETAGRVGALFLR